MIAGSSDALLGKKTIYHGTSKKNEDSIKRTGLQTRYGGKGASSKIGNKDLKKHSAGKVHFTTSKKTAKGYANAMDAYAKAPGLTKIGKQKYLDKLKKEGKFKDFEKKAKGSEGAIIKAKMDYNKFKKAEIDPDDSRNRRELIMTGKITNKPRAYRVKASITPEEIIGGKTSLKNKVSHTTKELPNYIKKNPGRFSAGAMGTGAGAALSASAIKDILDYRKKRDEDEYNSSRLNEEYFYNYYYNDYDI